MRFSFVGYKDHCDGIQRVVSADFVEEVKNSSFEKTVCASYLEHLVLIFRTQLESCVASGGGDGPEDIAGGLEICTKLTWRSSTRLLIHIPCTNVNLVF